jgi:hypothetical protein
MSINVPTLKAYSLTPNPSLLYRSEYQIAVFIWAGAVEIRIPHVSTEDCLPYLRCNSDRPFLKFHHFSMRKTEQIEDVSHMKKILVQRTDSRRRLQYLQFLIRTECWQTESFIGWLSWGWR